MIKPGATIGILGGGQLGRMLALAAAPLGYRCHIYAPERNAVAAEVSAAFTCAQWTDSAALARFAESCDVITWEFENVPVGPIAPLEPLLAPGPRALETAQDRLKEKQFVTDLGGQPAGFAAVDSLEDLRAAIERIGAPGILKTRRDGYDGKGQWRIASAHEADGISLPQNPMIYEAFIRFSAEFSVILVRSRDGDIHYYDSPHNIHRDGILDSSTLPAGDDITAQEEEARALAKRVADTLGYVGVLTLEFFATENGPVFNEMAPRVHNSGHWTIEGAAVSQFENHIRAICGLPLGNCSSANAPIVMRNLIGPEAHEAGQYLAEANAHLHLYGKGEARAGRKMGHVTWVGDEAAAGDTHAAPATGAAA